MNSKAYILGFLCGLAVVVIAGLVLRYIFKKKCLIGSGEYDERQKAIQGTGYKYAYFTALAYGIIENGQLGLNATNLLTGLCCIYLAAMMLVRTIWERRQEDAE